MKKIYIISTVIFLLFSCSKDNELEKEESSPNQVNIEKLTQLVNQGVYDDSSLGLYKGVFTTNDASTRAIVKIALDGKNIPVAEITTIEGNTFTLVAAKAGIKAAGGTTYSFSSNQASFDFKPSETGKAFEIKNVIFKEKKGNIVIAKQTSKALISLITGSYKCIDCNHPILGTGKAQTFNFLFIGNWVFTQATLDETVYSNVNIGAYQSDCGSSGGLTNCSLISGNGNQIIAIVGNTGPVTMEGIHTFNDNCESVYGTFIYDSSKFGVSELSFTDDANCLGSRFRNIVENFDDAAIDYSIKDSKNKKTIAADISKLDQNYYYGIIKNQDAPNSPYTAKRGTSYFGAQNTKKVNKKSDVIYLFYDSMNISDINSLEFSAFFATFDSNPSGDWDAGTIVKVEYSFNNRTWIPAFEIASGPGADNFVYEDTDFDGVGNTDGIRITDRFTKLKTVVPTLGNSSVSVRIVMANLNNDQEDIGIDNFAIIGKR